MKTAIQGFQSKTDALVRWFTANKQAFDQLSFDDILKQAPEQIVQSLTKDEVQSFKQYILANSNK